MCQSQAEGGKRCAAHTRGAYEAAVRGGIGLPPQVLADRLDSAFDAVVAHARTPAGAEQIATHIAALRTRYENHAATERYFTQHPDPTRNENIGVRPRLGSEHERVLVTMERALVQARDLNLRDEQVAADLRAIEASWNKPTAASLRDGTPRPAWWQPITGTEPTDLEDLHHCLHSPLWVDTWNATPISQRRPIRLFHGSRTSDPDFTGPVHFGDTWAATARIVNTVEYGDEAWMIEVEYRGDLHPVVPDTVANLVAHPDLNRGASFETYLQQECQEAGIDPDETISSVEEFLHHHPDGAVAYLNNTEGTSDGEASVSVVANTPEEGWTILSVRPFDDSDWDQGYA